jgi:molybdopterin synthase catalytic subunit
VDCLKDESSYDLHRVVYLKNYISIKREELSPTDLFSRILKNPEIEKAGALASFFGIVRGMTHQGEMVKGLDFEAYETEVIKKFEEISKDIRVKYGVIEVTINHVTGRLKVGDLIMAISVLGSSRKNVFPALQETVERVKKEAPIWKKEFLMTGESQWIEYES